jgi:hypothetical protein
VALPIVRQRPQLVRRHQLALNRHGRSPSASPHDMSR